MSHNSNNTAADTLEIKITGQVQGVGFRPFIYRIAIQHHLTGWVQNRSGEVIALLQGQKNNLNAFQQSVLQQHPPLAKPVIDTITAVDSAPLNDFVIKHSAKSLQAQRHIPPDFFTCNDCLTELSDPRERRYRYPFINCTQCGPRYTIIADLPYDRPNTSMSDFPLCLPCHDEYSNTLDRRFHAQPLACSTCGPELSFISCPDTPEKKITGNKAALAHTIAALKQGLIIAIKGIGGYHLICDATNNHAVQRLRQRKHRPDKPLAVMFSELAQLRQYCLPDNTDTETVAAPQRPIVLMKTGKKPLAQAINPGINEIGAMLAYSPLHFLILSDFGLPIVATSGNLSGEPVLTDNYQAEQRLKPIADAFLQHNRAILRPADDSVVRIIHHKKRLLRIGRGLAPLEFDLPYTVKKPLLAVGGQMKNTIALAWDKRVVISPHIGELDSKRSTQVFAQVIADLCQLYRVTPKHIICDAHPDYYSSRYARDYAHTHEIPLSEVQHHKAHAAIVCGAYDIHSAQKHDSTGRHKNFLVFTWDGTGLGDDQSIWGGEGFYGYAGHWQRVTSIKPFYLQGGDKAAREPWRSACAILWDKLYEDNTFAEHSLAEDELQEQCIHQAAQQLAMDEAPVALAFHAWKKRLNTIQSSSIGRLFDAASALSGLGNYSSFEGQGPMLLEALLTRTDTDTLLDNSDNKPLPLYTHKNDGDTDKTAIIMADWSELVTLLENNTLSTEHRALCFHLRIAETLIAQAQQIKADRGDFCVGLSGGVFQNKFLTETIIRRLEEEHFTVFLPDTVPYNDAGLAFGQIIEGNSL